MIHSGHYCVKITHYPDPHFSDVGGPGWSFRLRPKFWSERPVDNNWANHFVTLAYPGVAGVDTEHVPVMVYEYVLAPYIWPAEKDEGICLHFRL